jgi:hypothetical protein
MQVVAWLTGSVYVVFFQWYSCSSLIISSVFNVSLREAYGCLVSSVK